MRKEHIKDLRQMIKAFEKMTAYLEEIIEEAEEPTEGSLVWRKFILTEEWLLFTSWTTEWNVYIVEKCYTYFWEMAVDFKNDEWGSQTVFINKHIILLNNNK